MSTPGEKRQWQRVPARGVVGHLLFAEQSMPCQVRNVSAGGARIEVDHPKPPGSVVGLNLARAGWSKALRVTGKVVNSDTTAPASLGVQFDALDPYCRAELSQLLRELGGSMIGPSPRPAVVHAPSEAQKASIQVRGLLMQLADQQQKIDQSDRELSTLRTELAEKDQALAQALKDKAAAELTVHSLAMRLAARAHQPS